MALVPRLLRPSVLIRRRAMYDGVLGPSAFWKGVAVVVFGRSTLKKVFGKQPESLGTEVLAPGQFVCIEAIEPLTRKQRKQARKAS